MERETEAGVEVPSARRNSPLITPHLRPESGGLSVVVWHKSMARA